MNNRTNDAELQMEIKRLQKVEDVIDHRLQAVQLLIESRSKHAEDIRRNFWDQVTVNLSDDTEMLETFTSIQQEARVLAEQERSERDAVQLAHTLTRLQETPYFGRVDFQADGDPHEENIYIGLASLVANDGETFYIYDWRAPISSLFYDHSPGPAAYHIPDGQIQGQMGLKRQYIIRQGKLEHMFDTDVTIGDALLQQALSQNANSQMKSIVATIQREQNRIIRDESHRLLIVQGAAGSGKTSAALQRVAYLLYRYRGSLTADQIVLFSPNPLFSSYISTVLPELGEANMRQSTFQEYLSRRLRRLVKPEDLYEQTEFILAGRNAPLVEERLQAIEYKSSPSFFAIMNRYVKLLEQQGMKFRDLQFRGRTLISSDELEAMFYAEDLRKYEIGDRIEEWHKGILIRLSELEKEERRKRWVAEAIDLLDDETYREAYEKIRGKGGFKGETFDDERKERALLRKMVVAEKFQPLKKKVKRNVYIDFIAIYRSLFQDQELFTQLSEGMNRPAAWNRFSFLMEMAMEQGRLFYEDATPLLYLLEMITGFRESDNTVRHVLIDEAQDYSPFQFAFIRRLFPRARMTILGDLNQAIYRQTADVDGFAQLRELYADGSCETITLLRSYRSTKPIVEFSKQLLPGASGVEPFQRDGLPPVIEELKENESFVVRATGVVKQWLASGMQNIGLLTYSAHEADHIYKRLKEQMDVRLATTETIQLQAGATIMPAYLAKGIEFDAVLIWNASTYREEDRKLLYTACTRAMHELVLFVEHDQPGLLEDIMKGEGAYVVAE